MELKNFSNKQILECLNVYRKLDNPRRLSFDHECFFFSIYLAESSDLEISNVSNFKMKIYDKLPTSILFKQELIDVMNDHRFKDMPWKDLFLSRSERYQAEINAYELCNIVRYCAKLAELRTFW